jgi:predicted nucleotidyltransferase
MEILEKLKVLKNTLLADGFVIDGVVGSYAHGNFTPSSDIDLLYHVEKKFLDLYGGFGAFSKLREIQYFLENEMGKDIDLIPSNNLSKTAKKFMLKKVLHV